MTFCFGYAIIIAIPGPNTMLVAANAAASGLHRTMPLIVSVAMGAVSLAVGMGLLVSLSADQQFLIHWMPIISAVMLVVVALRVSSLRADGIASSATQAEPNRCSCWIGFVCGLTNPITASYFLSQYLIDDRLTNWRAVALLGCAILAVALAILTVFAMVMHIPAVKHRVCRHFRMIRTAAAATIFVMALLTMWRFFLPSAVVA
jgi:threonine/homoserine/homoserine lactone efflux protein